MISISLCMIVKDEEKVLARCLDSVKDAVDEIIIVDTGSRDGTKEVAGGYTGYIYDFPWQDDFSAARNEAFSKASMEYCMWLDADDVLPGGSAEKLLQLKEELPTDTDMVMMPYAAMGAEDFAFIKEKKPGIFIRLGSRTPGGPYGSAHSSTFYSDPKCLPTGMLTIIGLAADYFGFEV